MTKISIVLLVSAIIPSSRGPEALNITLEHLLFASAIDTNLELIIINDGNNSEISKLCSELKAVGYNLRELINETAEGSYKARNQGIAVANGEWLLFADDNLIVPSNWLETVRPYFSKAYFICCNVQVQKKQRETLAELYHRSKGFRAQQKFKDQAFGLSTFLLVNGKIFNKIGYFDDRLYSGGDLEFSQRVYHAEFKQIWLEKLKVYHLPKNWYDQFFTTTRILKGCKDLEKYYPQRYAHLQLNLKSLLRTLKYLAEDLIFVKRTPLYQTGKVNFFQHELAQVIYYSLHFLAQVLVLAFPNKKFNW